MYGEIPSFLEPFVQDYKIFVFDVAYLPEETRNKFTSDFKVVADLFAIADSKERKHSLIHFDSVMDLLEVFGGEEFVAEVKNNYEGGDVAMFDIAGRYEAKGEVKGIITTCEELGLSREDTLALVSKKLCIPQEDAQRLYDEYKARECALV